MRQPSDAKKKFKPVKVIGKQPGADVWVFNHDVHMDQNGCVIAIEDREFILESKKHEFLVNLTEELDRGESLAELFRAEKSLFVNNFAQVLMVHAVSAIAANFDLVIDKFDGCGIPVLIGHPVSGKSTALKAALSVFGDTKLVNSVTKKYIESRQAKTTVPFGWDDVADPKTLGEVAVASFNQAGSATMRGESKPHTVPIVTTNLDSSHLKIKSRWFRIQFEELSPKFKGQERCKREDELKKAMTNSKKSIHVITSYIHKCLSGISVDPEFEEVELILEEACNRPDLSEVDHRAQRQFSIMLFCCKKILVAVDMENEFKGVVEKMRNVILPNYVKTSSKQTISGTCYGKDEQIEQLLKDIMPKVLLSGDKSEVLKFFDQDFLPQRCGCGEAVTFHVSSLVEHLREKGIEEAKTVTDHSLRFFIKERGIGCVGRQVLFRNRTTQVSAAHIQRDWFNSEDMHALDEWLGKRNKKGRGKSKGVKVAVQVNSDQSKNLQSDGAGDVQAVINDQLEMENERARDVQAVPNDQLEMEIEGVRDIQAVINDQLEMENERARDVQAVPNDQLEMENEGARDVQAVINDQLEMENEGARDVQVIHVTDQLEMENERACDVQVIHENDQLEMENARARDVQVIHANDQLEMENERARDVQGPSNVSKTNTRKVGRKRRGIEKLQDAWNNGQSVEGKRTRAKSSRS